ncbi:hypothetical protein B0H13DRAFT_1878575 [Mycena leptocephala]|nr:hypothetical protein B0H13DRAFT_1878575 [Mycena leptocephala]
MEGAERRETKETKQRSWRCKRPESLSIPENPCLFVICPAIPLQLEMHGDSSGREYEGLSLDVLPINSLTRAEMKTVQYFNIFISSRKTEFKKITEIGIEPATAWKWNCQIENAREKKQLFSLLSGTATATADLAKSNAAKRSHDGSAIDEWLAKTGEKYEGSQHGEKPTSRSDVRYHTWAI